MKKTLGHVEEPLKLVPAVALLGGTAMYLLAHVGFRYRHIHSVNTRRLGLAVLLVAFVPVAVEIPALAAITVVAVALALLIVIETRGHGDARERVRHELRHEME
jgi:low temperature requirement protein LtrA